MINKWQELTSAWFESAEQGRVGDVRRLLRDGVRVDARDEHRRTALMLAAGRRRIEVVRCLLAHGADPNAQDSRTWTALTYAVNRPSPHFSTPNPRRSSVGPSRAILTTLSEAGGELSLREAVILGDVRLTRALCDAGADPSADAEWFYHDTHLMVATYLGHLEVARVLLDRGADIDGEDDLGDRALMRAAAAGRVGLAALLLDRGANLDEPNWAWVTALSMAAVEGNEDVVELFLRRGARRDLFDAIALDDAPLVRRLLENPRVRNGIPDYPDRSSYPPLGRPAMYAARRGRAEIVMTLLRNGAERDVFWHDAHSLLAEAAYHGHVPVVRLLLAAGADVNAVGSDGQTALDWAARGGHDEVIHCLDRPSA